MHASLAHTDHRPWSLPERPWRWRQAWCDLLFAHWKVPASSLRALVPAGLEIDTFHGSAWIGVVPFRMADVTHRGLPAVPRISYFAELNVRTYVKAGDRPGVWFFSLDAASRLAVVAGRRLFHLPYFRAAISIDREGERFTYRSDRKGDRGRFDVEYAPSGPPELASSGSLEHWLTERYCLYAESPDGRLLRTEVHHEPWPLQTAEALFTACEPGRGLNLKGAPDLTHFASRVDVVAWSPRRVVPLK